MNATPLKHAAEMLGQARTTLTNLDAALPKVLDQHTVLTDLMSIARRTGAASNAVEGRSLVAAHTEAVGAVKHVSSFSPHTLFSKDDLAPTIRFLDGKLKEAADLVQFRSTPPSSPALPDTFRTAVDADTASKVARSVLSGGGPNHADRVASLTRALQR